MVMRSLVSNTPHVQHTILWPYENGADVDGATVIYPPRGPRITRAIVKATIAEVRPDIVHAHSSWAGAITRTLKGIRPIYQPHAFAFQGRGGIVQRKTYWAIERLLARRTHTFVVVSEEERRLARSLYKRSTVRFIPNVSSLPKTKITPPSGTSAPRIVMSGRISPQKDPLFFAKVARIAKNAHLQWEFVWIGDGDSKTRDRLLASGVRVTGWLSPRNVHDELARSNIYLHSAAYEGFPLSVLDAVACNIPVIARSIPSLADYGIQTADSETDAVQVMCRVLSDANFREGILEMQAHLAEIMSEDRQRDSAYSLYETVL